jgi:hypothetical protein
MALTFLSKSNYLIGLACPKRLWHEINRPEMIGEESIEQKEIMKQGKIVGEHARRLYPDGRRIERHADPAITNQRSLLALKERKPLFEAGFTYNNAYALADILLPAEGNSWYLIEVKSSGQVKDEHLLDAAFQKYVYEGAGITIRRCFLMHINTRYVRRGELELDKLLVQEEISEAIRLLIPEIEGKVAELLNLVNGPLPEIKVGPQCSEYCPLEEHCWQFLPDQHHTFMLKGKRDVAFDLLGQGIVKMEDIPVDYELNKYHSIQVEAHTANKPFVDRDSLEEFLDRLRYPLYFIDFETIAPAIPVYEETRPFEDLVFQYSLHVLEKEGARPVHYSYLAPGNIDPRPEVIRQLTELLGKSGSILAYYADYEKRCIKSMVERVPEYAAWFEATVNRFIDLFIPFRRMFYYSPVQEGSASMKKVLPALTGISYADLEIGNGGLARYEYMRATFGKDVAPADRQRVRAALEKYCELDTLGMIKILEALKKALIGIHRS